MVMEIKLAIPDLEMRASVGINSIMLHTSPQTDVACQ